MIKIHCPELFTPRRPAWQTPEREAYLRANVGIDAAILADALGIKELFVRNYQIKLGLRTCVPARKGK